MVKVMYNDKLVYKVVIWVIIGISLWAEKEALNKELTEICGTTSVHYRRFTIIGPLDWSED